MIASTFLTAGIAYAGPSSTCWTPMTMDIQSYGVLHLGVDNYFTVLRKADNGGSSFPTDTGLTMGVLPFDKIQMEVGVDWLEPSDYPFYFNAKIGTPEDSLFNGSPALAIGIFNVGTKTGVTDQDIGYAVIGKTIPGVGRFSAGWWSRRIMLPGIMPLAAAGSDCIIIS